VSLWWEQDVFNRFGPVDGKLPGGAAKRALVETGVDKKVLRDLWPLSDIDKDGESARHRRGHGARGGGSATQEARRVSPG
jgi:hypothetical protein